MLELPQCQHRVVKALGVDADGTSILVTRFVSPTPLPPSLVQVRRHRRGAVSGIGWQRGGGRWGGGLCMQINRA